MIKLYLCTIILCLAVSMLTNQSTHPKLIYLNDLSNHMIAYLVLPIYVPYRLIKYVVLNIDYIMIKIDKLINSFLLYCVKLWHHYVESFLKFMTRWLQNMKYIYIIFIKPIFTFIMNQIYDAMIISLHKILIILDWLWHLILEYIVWPIYNILTMTFNIANNMIQHLMNRLSLLSNLIIYILNHLVDLICIQMQQIYNILINTILNLLIHYINPFFV